MKSTTRLDSVVFHLTPTRTRCDLIIIANGNKQKIASGLLNPFLAHLKSARDQIEKGGYSILLEPEDKVYATWFTKGTVERFVRFVSTPEILERVYTLESEILQIDEAIAIQGKNDTGQGIVERHEIKPTGSVEGNKTKPDPSEEKAIVLYKPEGHQSQTNGECSNEESSRVKLLKVLETRKTVLQKEQGMAFARAVAAGFDVDYLEPLVSFADCFGALRLMDACMRFVDLWKKKHETGQWLEIDTAEAMLGRPDFSAMNASGIVLSSVSSKQNDMNGELASGNNEKQVIDNTAGERPPANDQAPVGQQDYFQGQLPHPMYPWPMHSPPGTLPMFPAYPVQGMPYYQAFPGNVPFYQPPCPPMEDPRLNATPRTGQKRQSMDGRDSNQESETWDIGTSKSGSSIELDREASQTREAQKKAGRSGKKKSGVVVIRNINYITSEAKNSAGVASESASDSETASEGEDKNLKSSTRKGSHSRSMDKSNYDTEENFYAKETDGGNWQAFQSFLLSNANEENHNAKERLFAMENDVKMRRRQNTDSDDPLSLGGRDSNEIRDRRLSSIHEANGNVSRKPRVSNDAVIFPGYGSDIAKGLNDQMDMHFAETNGRRVISRTSNDAFIIANRDDQLGLQNSSYPLAVNGFERANNKLDGASSHDVADESFIVPFRSMSLNQVGSEDRTAIDMDSELPSTHQKSENNGIRNQVSYEPDELSLIPERGTERRSIGYDPALDYEMQIYDEGSVSMHKSTKELVTDIKENTKKSEKSRSSKVTSDTIDKKRIGGGPMRKGKPSKMSPLEDARARAEKLRAFKADIQKLKKEKEEADLKRLEALKLERQKRIAARVSSGSVGSTAAHSLQARKTPTKLSPIANRGSKFSDLEPGSSSPLQRSKVRTLGSKESNKASKPTKPSEGSLLQGNRLSRSVSSLPEQKKEMSRVTPDSKVSMARIRRLSEPKAVGHHSATPKKVRSAEPAPKLKSDGPDSKKISAIIHLDKSKAASLPELKIRTPKGPSNVTQKNLAGRDMMKVEEAKPSVTSQSYVNNAKLSHQSEADDNPIIDKTVVMLECDKPSVSVEQASGDKVRPQNSQYDNNDRLEESEAVSEFTSMRAPPSPTDGVHRDAKAERLQDHSNSSEARENRAESSLKLSNINNAEKPYQAPYARISSLEDPTTRNSDYGKAPHTSSGMMSTTSKAYVVNEKTYRVDCIPETSAKLQVKESPKGFRRLLKFGKKNHNSAAGDQYLESDNASTSALEPHSNATSNVPTEVLTLKNLISEDETPTSGNGSQKSSRHFSLLAPFRSKTSEKKLTT